MKKLFKRVKKLVEWIEAFNSTINANSQAIAEIQASQESWFQTLNQKLEHIKEELREDDEDDDPSFP